LQPSDFCDRIGMHPSESRQPSLLEPGGFQKDGPERLSVIEIAASQSPRDVIEGTSGVVNTVADDACQPLLRNRLKNLQPEQILALVRIEFSNNTVGLRIQELRDLRVKRLRMFFGATQLVPAFP
jgi:hypothetical protein